eukprot:TRINITY_DN718_c0_g1_i4.p1 TRINITY_DN718_c0_g1~~TRINITY_DN718_c0_g1_i4.p1  ORF type:complete len:155 (-),score=22.37 TRINITY_DN718_c0_g1_i4:74-538(-)
MCLYTYLRVSTILRQSCVLHACFRVSVFFFFFNDTATTEIYTILFVGSVRCVQETGINAEYMGAAAGFSFDFIRGESNMYLASTEEGSIHKCSKSYAEQYLESYFGHTGPVYKLSLIHISEPTRQAEISYAVFCLKKKKKQNNKPKIQIQLSHS